MGIPMLEIKRQAVLDVLVARLRLLRGTLDTPPWRLVATVICLGVIGFQLYRQLQPSVWPGMDFQAYYNGALAVRHGVNPYGQGIAYIHNYRASDQGSGTHIHSTYMGYIYSPLLAALLIPFTFFPLQTALVLWGVCSLLLLLVAIYSLLRAADIRPTLLHVLVLGIAAARLWPVELDFRVGQVNVFLLCCLSTALWARQARRPGLAGVLLAVGCVTKPTLVYLVIFLLWKREWKFAAATGIGFVGLLLAPFVWLGAQPLRDLLAVWSFSSGPFVAHLYSFAPKSMLARLLTVNPFVRPLFVAPVLASVLGLVLAALIAILCAAVVSPAPLKPDVRSLFETSVVTSALLLLSPITEEHHLALLVLPFVAAYLVFRQTNWRLPAYRWPLIGFVAVALLYCPNVQKYEWLIWPHMGGNPSIMADIYTLAAVPYLYLLLALFGLQVFTLALYSDGTLQSALHQVIADAPSLLRHWVEDLVETGVGTARRVRGELRRRSDVASACATLDATVREDAQPAPWSAAAREGAYANQPWLSVVIPAFNEAQRLHASLAQLQTYLKSKPAGSEVIVVDDGSTDGTSEVVQEWMGHLPGLRLVVGPHAGKGAAIRAGALAANGLYVAFADADFSMPATEFDRFAPEIAGTYDLAIGSRELPGAHRYGEPAYRHLMGRVFNKLVQTLLLPGIQDSQCGFKCLRHEVARDLCVRQTVEGWGFDVELLYLARLRGYRLHEVPVEWHYAAGSRVHPIRDTVTMVHDVLAIRSSGAAERARLKVPAIEQAGVPEPSAIGGRR